jgi:hypothetical protein
MEQTLFFLPLLLLVADMEMVTLLLVLPLALAVLVAVVTGGQAALLVRAGQEIPHR